LALLLLGFGLGDNLNLLLFLFGDNGLLVFRIVETNLLYSLHDLDLVTSRNFHVNEMLSLDFDNSVEIIKTIFFENRSILVELNSTKEVFNFIIILFLIH